MNSIVGGNMQGQLIANGEQLSLGLDNGSSVNFSGYYISDYRLNIRQDLIPMNLSNSEWRENIPGMAYAELQLNINSSGVVTMQEGFSLIAPATFNRMTVMDLFKLINEKIEERK